MTCTCGQCLGNIEDLKFIQPVMKYITQMKNVRFSLKKKKNETQYKSKVVDMSTMCIPCIV